MTTNYTPTRVANWAFPLFILVAGLVLIGFGWTVENGVHIKNLTLDSFANAKATVLPQVVVVPNGNQAPAVSNSPPAPPVVVPAPPVVPAPVSNGSIPAPAPAAGQVAAAPVITVTATLVPPVTETFPPAIVITPITATPVASPATGANVSGHCTQWTNGECAVNPTATPAPVYEPPVVTQPTATALPPTPTITPTPLPESNSISSIVTLQGAKKHGGTSVIVTNSGGVVTTHTTTNEGGLFQLSGLDKGTYQLAAYSPNGSHLPACTTVSVSGNESIAIPQTMLSNGGGFNTDETVNIGAAALVAIQFGLTIPEHMVPILDVSRDGAVTETDANMLIANPRLLSCQAW